MTCSPLRGLRTSLAWRNAPENNLNYLEALRQAPARWWQAKKQQS